MRRTEQQVVRLPNELSADMIHRNEIFRSDGRGITHRQGPIFDHGIQRPPCAFRVSYKASRPAQQGILLDYHDFASLEALHFFRRMELDSFNGAKWRLVSTRLSVNGVMPRGLEAPNQYERGEQGALASCCRSCQ